MYCLIYHKFEAAIVLSHLLRLHNCRCRRTDWVDRETDQVTRKTDLGRTESDRVTRKIDQVHHGSDRVTRKIDQVHHGSDREGKLI